MYGPARPWSQGNRDGHCFHRIRRLQHHKEDPELHHQSVNVGKRTSQTTTLIVASVLRSELVKELSTAENWRGAHREINADIKTTTDTDAEGGISSDGQRQEAATNAGAADVFHGCLRYLPPN